MLRLEQLLDSFWPGVLLKKKGPVQQATARGIQGAVVLQMLRVCDRQLRLRNVVQHEMTRDGTTWADVAATAADGTRVAIVHLTYYNRLRGPDGFARHPDARGLMANTNARIRVLAWEGYRVCLTPGRVSLGVIYGFIRVPAWEGYRVCLTPGRVSLGVIYGFIRVPAWEGCRARLSPSRAFLLSSMNIQTAHACWPGRGTGCVLALAGHFCCTPCIFRLHTRASLGGLPGASWPLRAYLLLSMTNKTTFGCWPARATGCILALAMHSSLWCMGLQKRAGVTDYDLQECAFRLGI